ncbi:MAG: carbohydrate binding family 9 domain-containing protein [Cyclobacteriaceae bacterium]
MNKIIVVAVVTFMSLAGFAQNGANLQDTYQISITATSEEINIDGELDEAVWANAQVATDFWYSFPVDDKRAEDINRTEVQLTYDDEFIYLAAKCYGVGPYVVQSLKRDNPAMWRGDAFAIVLDPVNERTNGFVFATNPAGVQSESLITGQTGRRGSQGSSGMNTAWDNKWYVDSKTYENYWTVEMAIPFKSLRFGDKQRWGINFVRSEMKTNAYHTWSPVPVQFRGVDLGYTGVMNWDKAPKKTKKNISVIPYALGSGYKDIEEGEELDLRGRVGADAKVAITSGLNLDVTVNPDFSQVDVDQQVTNLNTFSVRFPERRLFFLENSDIFSDFGIPPLRPFFSRRIGLDEDANTIPILFGARLSGNVNKNLRIGVMNMQTGEDVNPGNNYTSMAFHQRVFGRSVVKGYMHNRQAFVEGESQSDDYNRMGGLEYQYRSVDGKWEAFGGGGLSYTDVWSTENYFYKIGGGYEGRAFSWYANISGLGDGYIADLGFMPRKTHYDAIRDTTFEIGLNHWYSRIGYTIYPENPAINQHRFGITSIADLTTTGKWINHQLSGSYNMSMNNSSQLSVEASHNDKELIYPFAFTDGEPLPAGTYSYNSAEITYRSDSRRIFSFEGGIMTGGFYNGNIFSYGVGANLRVQPWGNFSMNFEQNNLRFPSPYGSEKLLLIGPKAEVNFSRNMFWTTFLQYNTQRDNFNINSRFQWRYLPMSDLFIVYSDNYAVEQWGPKNRGLVIKLNYWLNL